MNCFYISEALYWNVAHSFLSSDCRSLSTSEILYRTVHLEAFVVLLQTRLTFSMWWCGCFGEEPLSNQRRSSSDPSKPWGPCGKLQTWLMALFMSPRNKMYVQKQYKLHLPAVSHEPGTPVGVADFVETRSNPLVIYKAIAQLVFLPNISDLLWRSQGVGLVLLRRRGSMSNFKSCLNGLGVTA